MDAIFQNVWEMSLFVIPVIFVFALLSNKLGERYGTKWRYLLWVVIAVRLCIPVQFSLPDFMMGLRVEVPSVQNEARVTELSRKYQVVGVHMFCLSDWEGISAECRNFAPLYAIPEESATGTANGALTYYLYQYGIIEQEKENVFYQGEAMGKPSYIKSVIEFKGTQPKVKIGGEAVISLKGELINGK